MLLTFEEVYQMPLETLKLYAQIGFLTVSLASVRKVVYSHKNKIVRCASTVARVVCRQVGSWQFFDFPGTAADPSLRCAPFSMTMRWGNVSWRIQHRGRVAG